MDSHDQSKRITWTYRIPKSPGQTVYEEATPDYGAVLVQTDSQRSTERSVREVGSQIAQRHLPRFHHGLLGVLILGRQSNCQVLSRAALEERIEVAKRSI